MTTIKDGLASPDGRYPIDKVIENDSDVSDTHMEEDYLEFLGDHEAYVYRERKTLGSTYKRFKIQGKNIIEAFKKATHYDLKNGEVIRLIKSY